MSLATGEFSVFGANLKSGDAEPTVTVEASVTPNGVTLLRKGSFLIIR